MGGLNAGECYAAVLHVGGCINAQNLKFSDNENPERHQAIFQDETTFLITLMFDYIQSLSVPGLKDCLQDMC